jgi:hypothetical protein
MQRILVEEFALFTPLELVVSLILLVLLPLHYAFMGIFNLMKTSSTYSSSSSN